MKKKNKTGIHLFISISCTALSRVAGFIRTMAETAFLGLSQASDTYQAAFRLTNFFRELYGEGALGGVFTPLYSELQCKDGERAANSYFWGIVSGVFLSSAAISLILIFFLEPILNLWLPSFSEEKLALIKDVASIMLPYLCLIATGSSFMLFHQIKGRFLLSSLHPVLFSIAVIVSGYFNPLNHYPQSLALGVLAGGLLQLLLLCITAKVPFTSMKEIRFQYGAVRKTMILLLPVLFALAVSKINRLIDLSFASSLPSGSLSSLTYSSVLINVPLGLIAIASTNVFFPTLSRLKAGGDHLKFSEEGTKALLFLLCLGLPAAAIPTVYAEPVIRLLFVDIPSWMHIHTRFTEESAIFMGGALRFYSPGLLTMIISPLLVKIFQACQDTKTPAKLGLCIVCINISLNWFLTPAFAHKGIAAATSISSFIQALLLFAFLSSKNILKLKMAFLKEFIVNATMLALALWFSWIIPVFFHDAVKPCIAGLLYGIWLLKRYKSYLRI